MMEVDAPSNLPLETQLQTALADGDMKKALELVEEMEIDLEVESERPAAGFYTAVQMALYLINRDLDNARHLWRRSSDRLKGPGSPLSGLWTVGKHLWNREITQVYGALQGPWPSELQGLVERLQERIRQDELELVQRAFQRIKLSTLASHLGLDASAAAAVAKQAGWRVDENEAVVEPVGKPAPPREKLGLPHLDKLTTYVAFLEQKSVTSKAS